MEIFIETMKGASLHIHAVWLALTYIAVILAMAIDFVAGLRKAKAAGIASNSRGYKMTTEKAAKYFLPMLCLTCVDIMTIGHPAGTVLHDADGRIQHLL